MTTSVEQWKAKYKKNTGTAGDTLVANFSAANGMVAGMTSQAGVDKFKSKVTSDLAIAKRNYKLNKQGDQGLKAGMVNKGKAAYVKNTGLAVEKAGNAVQPFLQTIDSTVASLAARTDDIDQNVDNRVKPIDHALRAKAMEIYGAK